MGGYMKTIRQDILNKASETIMVDRQNTHGDAENNFATIAALWHTYLAGRNTIDAHDVAAMMVLFKIARFKSNPHHLDNMIDACGYAAFAGEIGAQKDIPPSHAISPDGYPIGE
jgi:hypothetical protein